MNLVADIKFTLELSPEEALFLKGVMQNPIGEESSTDYRLRFSLYESLPDFEQLYILQNFNK